MALKGSMKLDIGRLIVDLQEVTDWFKVGLILGVRHSVLKRIQIDHRGEGIERCMTEMLVYWRDNHNASLRRLADALEEANYNRLAGEMRHKYNVQAGSTTSGMLLEFDEVVNPRSTKAKKLLDRKCYIDESDSNLKKEYANFMKKLLDLLKTKEESVDNAILSVHLQDETALTSDMKEATDIQSFLAALRSTQSWYNFDITASLALDLGESEGQELVKFYETRLNVHLTKRRELYTGRIKTNRFVFKVNENPELFMEEKHVKFRRTIARILNLEQKDLVLMSAKSGCVELTYLVRADLAPLIRSAIRSCGKDFQDNNVISVKLNSELLWSVDLGQTKSGPGPKKLAALKDISEPQRSHIPTRKTHPTRIKMRSIPMPVSDFNQQHQSGHPCRRLCHQLILHRIGQRKRCLIVFVMILVIVLLVIVLWFYFN